MPPLHSNPIVHLELHTGDLPQARARVRGALRLAPGVTELDDRAGYRPSRNASRVSGFIAAV
jgi:hypothetical protein